MKKKVVAIGAFVVIFLIFTVTTIVFAFTKTKPTAEKINQKLTDKFQKIGIIGESYGNSLVLRCSHFPNIQGTVESIFCNDDIGRYSDDFLEFVCEFLVDFFCCRLGFCKGKNNYGNCKNQKKYNEYPNRNSPLLHNFILLIGVGFNQLSIWGRYWRASATIRQVRQAHCYSFAHGLKALIIARSVW